MVLAVSKEFNSLLKFEPDGDNYHIWINRVHMAICAYKTFVIIDNNIICTAIPAAKVNPAVPTNTDD